MRLKNKIRLVFHTSAFLLFIYNKHLKDIAIRGQEIGIDLGCLVGLFYTKPKLKLM